jgi:hypothetical protein
LVGVLAASAVPASAMIDRPSKKQRQIKIIEEKGKKKNNFIETINPENSSPFSTCTVIGFRPIFLDFT